MPETPVPILVGASQVEPEGLHLDWLFQVCLFKIRAKLGRTVTHPGAGLGIFPPTSSIAVHPNPRLGAPTTLQFGISLSCSYY